MMKKMLSQKRTLLAVALLLLLVFGLPAGRLALFLALPAGDGKRQQFFEFTAGASLPAIAASLEKGGVIGSARLFQLYARLRGDDSRVKAGPYLFSDGLRPGEILRKLVDGDFYQRRFSVPEGYSVYQLAELLEGKGFFKKETFLRRCFDPHLLKEVGIAGPSVEGYLFPSTYNITPTMDEAALIRTMVTQFEEVFTRDYAPRVASSGLTTREVVVLASLVEKEAAVPAERPLIAAVFRNRLRRGMPLQSDPTAVYGIRAFAGKVTKADIERPTPYNTYLIKGLPPGPIGNPGPEAIAAVLQPAASDALYFVAKNNGSHHFSRTLEEHNRAVVRYLRTPAPSRPPTEARHADKHPAGGR